MEMIDETESSSDHDELVPKHTVSSDEESVPRRRNEHPPIGEVAKRGRSESRLERVLLDSILRPVRRNRRGNQRQRGAVAPGVMVRAMGAGRAVIMMGFDVRRAPGHEKPVQAIQDRRDVLGLAERRQCQRHAACRGGRRGKILLADDVIDLIANGLTARRQPERAPRPDRR